MDYPTLVPIEGKTGIDAIEEYIDKIVAEQRFLAEFPPGYVEELLRSYTSDYKDQFFNLSEIVINKCKTDPNQCIHGSVFYFVIEYYGMEGEKL